MAEKLGDDDPFDISLFRHGNDDVSATVRGQTIRMSAENGRVLLRLLETWFYPWGRDVDPGPWPAVYDDWDFEGRTESGRE